MRACSLETTIARHARDLLTQKKSMQSRRSSESSCSASASGSAEGSVAALAETHSHRATSAWLGAAARSPPAGCQWASCQTTPPCTCSCPGPQALVAAKKTYSRPRDTHLEGSWTARPSLWQRPGQSAPPWRCPWPWRRTDFGGPSQCLGSRWPTCAASLPRGQGVCRLRGWELPRCSQRAQRIAGKEDGAPSCRPKFCQPIRQAAGEIRALVTHLLHGAHDRSHCQNLLLVQGVLPHQLQRVLGRAKAAGVQVTRKGSSISGAGAKSSSFASSLPISASPAQRPASARAHSASRKRTSCSESKATACRARS